MRYNGKSPNENPETRSSKLQRDLKNSEGIYLRFIDSFFSIHNAMLALHLTFRMSNSTRKSFMEKGCTYVLYICPYTFLLTGIPQLESFVNCYPSFSFKN